MSHPPPGNNNPYAFQGQPHPFQLIVNAYPYGNPNDFTPHPDSHDDEGGGAAPNDDEEEEQPEEQDDQPPARRADPWVSRRRNQTPEEDVESAIKKATSGEVEAFDDNAPSTEQLKAITTQIQQVLHHDKTVKRKLAELYADTQEQQPTATIDPILNYDPYAAKFQTKQGTPYLPLEANPTMLTEHMMRDRRPTWLQIAEPRAPQTRPEWIIHMSSWLATTLNGEMMCYICNEVAILMGFYVTSIATYRAQDRENQRLEDILMHGCSKCVMRMVKDRSFTAKKAAARVHEIKLADQDNEEAKKQMEINGEMHLAFDRALEQMRTKRKKIKFDIAKRNQLEEMRKQGVQAKVVRPPPPNPPQEEEENNNNNAP